MLYKFKENNLWGMVDEEGRVIVKPVFLKLSGFAENYALGTVDEKWFYINEDGRIVKRFNVDEMSLFYEGMARINLCGCTGYINREFQVVIEPEYGLFSGGFSEGLAPVCTPKIHGRELYGFINKKGRQVIDFKYEGAGNFSEGLSVVSLDDSFGAIDKNGRLVVENKYDWLNNFKEGRAFFKKEDLWGIVDSKGNEILKAEFEEDEDNEEHYPMQSFSEGFAVISKNGKYGYINREGRVASDIIYSSAASFHEGVALVRIEDRWFTLDKNFNTISLLNCDAVRDFNNGLAGICIEGKWGFIDRKGDLVIEAKYDKVFDFHNAAAAAILGGKYGYIDMSGKEFFRAEKCCEVPYDCFVL